MPKFYKPVKNTLTFVEVNRPKRRSNVSPRVQPPLSLALLQSKVEKSFLSSFALRRKVGRDSALSSRVGFAVMLGRAFRDLDRLHAIDPSGTMNAEHRSSLDAASRSLFPSDSLDWPPSDKVTWERLVGLRAGPKSISPSRARRKAARDAFFSAATSELPRSAWKKFRARTENSGLNKLIKKGKSRKVRRKRNPRTRTEPAEGPVTPRAASPSSVGTTEAFTAQSAHTLASIASHQAEQRSTPLLDHLKELYPRWTELDRDDLDDAFAREFLEGPEQLLTLFGLRPSTPLSEVQPSQLTLIRARLDRIPELQ